MSHKRTGQQERYRLIRNLLKDMRLHGLEPVPRFLTLAEAYVKGAITLADLAQGSRRMQPRGEPISDDCGVGQSRPNGSASFHAAPDGFRSKREVSHGTPDALWQPDGRRN
jgi:hypothetical protein